jgi:hypothetical protein
MSGSGDETLPSHADGSVFFELPIHPDELRWLPAIGRPSGAEFLRHAAFWPWYCRVRE